MDKLRELQLAELDILEAFAQICEEEHLRYYLLGGTLLGAIRHKGFIPWDDDVDVCMPRKDYERFLKIADKKLGDGNYLAHYYKDPEYYYPWARICNDKIRMINRMANNERVESLFIDIIPLDGFPDKGLRRTLHKMHLSLWWNLNQLAQYDKLVDQHRKRSTKGKIAVALAGKMKWIGKFITARHCLYKLNKILMKYPYDTKTKDIINFLAAYGFDETFPRKAFAKTRKYPFENKEFVGPYDYDVVLKAIYGDYMTLPPEDQRNKHQAEIIE